MADKYTEDEVKALGAKGHAFKNPDGHYSYPIADVEDLDNAIKAVGRGGADHDAIRKYVIGRAKALGKSSMIPGNWNPDGSLKGSASASRGPGWEQRRRRWAGSLTGHSGRRSIRFPAGCLEMRAKPDGTGGTNFQFRGYGATFAESFQMWDPWGDEYEEEVEPGAFTETLAFSGLDTPFLIGHNDQAVPLARTTNRTMHLEQDSHGLPVDALMDGRRSDVRDLAYGVEREDITEMSIGFVTRGQRWTEDWSKRYMTNLDLHRGDVSVVALAANPGTRGASMTALPVEILSRRPAEARIQSEIADLSTRPDFNLPSYDPMGHGPESIPCPNDDCPVYAGGDGPRALNAKDAKFCDQCGAPLYDSDGTIVLDDSGVVEEVNESMGDANLLARRLRLLELA